MLAMYHAKDFDEAFTESRTSGGGRRLWTHRSAVLSIRHRAGENQQSTQLRMKACRILINTPSSHGGIGDLYNFKLTPSLTLGCGSWGGNSVSENVGVKHLLNIKTVAERRENMLWFRAPQKVYLKKGCLPVALDELRSCDGQEEMLHRHRLLPVPERLYQAQLTDKLDEMGIQHTTLLSTSRPTRRLACATGGRRRR